MRQKLKAKKCRYCKREYQPIKYWQKFCSQKCAWTKVNRTRAKLVRKLLAEYERRQQSAEGSQQ